ncbi:chromosome partitioning protein [Cellulomonas sp. NTE-D12]|uniref:MinD/ParA family ATP-binding protein n=1 Tax=Cellulomonas sp. NTE-D12 TaxID=2962632 RepID=UPI0030815F33|nr:hypothetical protein CELD12_30220 [Cellulomonas sp. NTE-D12]
MTDGSSLTTSTGRVPTITAEVRDDGTGELVVDGDRRPVAREDLAQAGAEVTSQVAALAAELGRPLPVQVRDPDGVWSLLIHPDGRVDEAPPEPDEADELAAPPVPAAPLTSGAPVPGASAPIGAPASTAGATPAGATAAASSSDARTADARTAEPRATDTRSAADAAAGRRRDGEVLPTLEDLVSVRRSDRNGPARQGWQRGVRTLTFGAVKPGPGRAERRLRADIAAVRRSLDGPRTVVVINPKGGAHKTTATMLLASTFGLQRGGYTLAWDNNETHGTLGWRSAPSDHTRTAVDLLRSLPTLTSHGAVRIGDLDGYMRTQPTEQFDVLASDENAASVASVDAESFQRLHRLLSQFYRVLVVDTGNNMRASNWRAAVDSADQLVVVTTVREDTAQSAAWALDALRAMGHEEAVRKAVTVLSAPDPKVDKALQKRLRNHFGALTRTVVEVPYERALVSGGPIDYDKLRPATRRAWLRATAAVAEGL